MGLFAVTATSLEDLEGRGLAASIVEEEEDVDLSEHRILYHVAESDPKQLYHDVAYETFFNPGNHGEINAIAYEDDGGQKYGVFVGQHKTNGEQSPVSAMLEKHAGAYMGHIKGTQRLIVAGGGLGEMLAQQELEHVALPLFRDTAETELEELILVESSAHCMESQLQAVLEFETRTGFKFKKILCFQDSFQNAAGASLDAALDQAKMRPKGSIQTTTTQLGLTWGNVRKIPDPDTEPVAEMERQTAILGQIGGRGSILLWDTSDDMETGYYNELMGDFVRASLGILQRRLGNLISDDFNVRLEDDDGNKRFMYVAKAFGKAKAIVHQLIFEDTLSHVQLTNPADGTLIERNIGGKFNTIVSIKPKASTVEGLLEANTAVRHHEALKSSGLSRALHVAETLESHPSALANGGGAAQTAAAANDSVAAETLNPARLEVEARYDAVVIDADSFNDDHLLDNNDYAALKAARNLARGYAGHKELDTTVETGSLNTLMQERLSTHGRPKYKLVVLRATYEDTDGTQMSNFIGYSLSTSGPSRGGDPGIFVSEEFFGKDDRSRPEALDALEHYTIQAHGPDTLSGLYTLHVGDGDAVNQLLGSATADNRETSPSMDSYLINPNDGPQATELDTRYVARFATLDDLEAAEEFRTHSGKFTADTMDLLIEGGLNSNASNALIIIEDTDQISIETDKPTIVGTLPVFVTASLTEPHVNTLQAKHLIKLPDTSAEVTSDILSAALNLLQDQTEIEKRFGGNLTRIILNAVQRSTQGNPPVKRQSLYHKACEKLLSNGRLTKLAGRATQTFMHRVNGALEALVDEPQTGKVTLTPAPCIPADNSGHPTVVQFGGGGGGSDTESVLVLQDNNPLGHPAVQHGASAIDNAVPDTPGSVIIAGRRRGPRNGLL